MKYVLRTVIGLGLEVAGIVAVSYAIYKLLGVGTCASGGPYEIARECPEGTEWLGLAIPASVFVMLFGGGLYAARGAAPGSERKGGAGFALLLGWSGLFLGIAFACFWGVWGPDANPGPGGKEGGLIVGFLFVPMGLIPVWAALSGYRDKRRGSERPNPIVEQLEKRAPVVRKSSGARGPSDAVTQIERLQKLREQGAITEAEFQKLKAGVLGE
ncbi:MAG: SHOCT domain-containing protein [Actinomycetota bacterium]|nr:SHOCT domain-containing protein [Actinomycetota bacterium]